LATRCELASFASSGPVSEDLVCEHNFSSGEKKETWKDVKISSELKGEQKEQVEKLLEEFSDIFSNVPNQCSGS
jgi:hypothetical protein